MTVLTTILSGAAPAAIVTAAALLIQNWWQRRDAARQRTADHAHELALAEIKHGADLERLDREAALRVRERQHDQLLLAHQDVLVMLDEALAVSARIMSKTFRLPSDEPVLLGSEEPTVEKIGDISNRIADREKMVSILASREAAGAGEKAVKAVLMLATDALLATSPPGVTKATFHERYLDLFDAKSEYLAAIRRNIGVET